MTTKAQLATTDFDTISAQALEACTGGDGTNDELRGYGSPLLTGARAGAAAGVAWGLEQPPAGGGGLPRAY